MNQFGSNFYTFNFPTQSDCFLLPQRSLWPCSSPSWYPFLGDTWPQKSAPAWSCSTPSESTPLPSCSSSTPSSPASHYTQSGGTCFCSKSWPCYWSPRKVLGSTAGRPCGSRRMPRLMIQYTASIRRVLCCCPRPGILSCRWWSVFWWLFWFRWIVKGRLSSWSFLGMFKV